METTHNTSKNVKPVTIITENTEEKDDDTENILDKLTKPSTTRELVEDLRNFAYIIDESRGKANVIMLEGQIFREAADTIETLQELNEEWLNKWTQLINQTK
jgi:hypothetical protein